MAVDFVFKLVSADGTEFTYTPDLYEISSIDAEEIGYRLPVGETPGIDGEYQGTSVLDTKILSYSGQITDIDPDALRSKWDTFMAGHREGTPATFYRHSDRFVTGNIDGIRRGQDLGLGFIEWTVNLRLQPMYNEQATNMQALSVPVGSVGGTTTFTAGGNRRAWPLTSLTFASGGTAEITSIGAGQRMRVVARSAGTYLIDTEKGMNGFAGAVLRSPAGDVLNDFYGEFVELPTSSNSVTLTTSGGGTVSAGSMTWRKRHASG